MIYAPCLIHAPYELLMTKKGMVENVAFIDDPYFQKVQDVVARDVTSNPNNYVKTVKEAGIYELGLAWAIWMPAPYQYNLWWPWVNNYYGVSSTGWAGGKDWTKYIWVDQELKKSKGF